MVAIDNKIEQAMVSCCRVCLSSLCVCVCVYRHCVCVPLAQPLDAMNMMDSVLCNHIMYDSYIVLTLSDIFFLSCIIGSLSLAF